MSSSDVKSALATLIATEPPMPTGTADIERLGRQRVARRRLGGGFAVAAVFIAAASFATAGLAGPDAPATPLAAAPTTAATTDNGAASGSQLAVGFTVDAALRALGPALPVGVNVGELPMDIGWREGGTLSLPVTTSSGPGTLTLKIDGGTCTATVTPADVIASGGLTTIANAVCAAWAEAGSPLIVPAGSPGPERPDLAAQ